MNSVCFPRVHSWSNIQATDSQLFLNLSQWTHCCTRCQYLCAHPTPMPEFNLAPEGTNLDVSNKLVGKSDDGINGR